MLTPPGSCAPGIIPRLHKFLSDPEERFSLYDAPTRKDVERSAVTAAAIHGFPDAFNRRPFLSDAPDGTSRRLPREFGGRARPTTPLSPALLRIVHPDHKAKPPVEAAPTAPPSPFRAFVGLGPPQPAAAAKRTTLNQGAALDHDPGEDPPPRLLRDVFFDSSAEHRDGASDPPARADGKGWAKPHADADSGEDAKPHTATPARPASGDDAPALHDAAGELRAATDGLSAAREAAFDKTTRLEALRTLTEFHSRFPLLVGHLYSDDRDAPIEACNTFPLSIVVAAAEAAANQWYGLVLAMNTAAILKGKLLPASGLLAQMLATPQNFDATSVRKLDEGSMSTDPPTPVERAFNLIRVGQFALDIACDFVAYGSTTIADAIYDAADRLVLVNPGSGPNTPTFDTLAAVVHAVRRATTARAPFNHDRVLMALTRAVVDLRGCSLVVNDRNLGSYATDVRTRYHQRVAAQAPATLRDVQDLIADLESMQSSIALMAAADDAIFGRPPAKSHFTLPTPAESSPHEESESDLLRIAALEAAIRTREVELELEQVQITLLELRNARGAAPPVFATSTAAAPRPALASNNKKSRDHGAEHQTGGPTGDKCWGPRCKARVQRHYVFCYSCGNFNPKAWICDHCRNENNPEAFHCVSNGCQGTRTDGRPMDATKDAARLALIAADSVAGYHSKRRGIAPARRRSSPPPPACPAPPPRPPRPPS